MVELIGDGFMLEWLCAERVEVMLCFLLLAMFNECERKSDVVP